jgi:predicted RNase H-like nuclease (RuvC/YqgF family)
MDDSFKLLEEKVKKAAELVRRLREENRGLSEELGRVRPKLSELEKSIQSLEKQRGASADESRKLDALSAEVQRLREERTEVRQRIARMVEVLDGLD